MISQSAEFINDRQKVEVSVVKKDAENEKGLSGAEFGLYAKEDIKAGDKVLVKADELLTKAVTGEDGKAVFEQDLPFGTYYIKELASVAIVLKSTDPPFFFIHLPRKMFSATLNSGTIWSS